MTLETAFACRAAAEAAAAGLSHRRTLEIAVRNIASEDYLAAALTAFVRGETPLDYRRAMRRRYHRPRRSRHG